MSSKVGIDLYSEKSDLPLSNKEKGPIIMYNSEELVRQFDYGLSFLEAYIKICNKTRLFDINIISEQFMCKLLNILYDYSLVNANETDSLTAGYDLISEKEKIVIQVTSECSTAKVRSCLSAICQNIQKRKDLIDRKKQLEKESKSDPLKRELLTKCSMEINKRKDLSGYRVIFLFLTIDASKVRKSNSIKRLSPCENILFNPDSDIIDFKDLSNRVLRNIITSDKEIALRKFMDESSDLFVEKSPCVDRVQSVIEEYANNFDSTLFLHKYDENSLVTLHNLYVDPAFIEAETGSDSVSRDIVNLLCDFLWQKPKNDRERIMFIEGDAAIGKTSLVSWLCYHYLNVGSSAEDTKGRAIFLNRKIICVRLRELVFEDNISPSKTILNYLNISDMKKFNRLYAKSIIILDGADELSMVTGVAASSIESFILDIRKTFSSHKIIVTTRPKFLNMEMFNKSTFKIRRVSLAHFSHEMRIEWLEKYKLCGEIVPATTEQYIRTMQEETAVGVADTPLALYLLVRCDMREDLQGNNWALFHEIFSNAIVDAEYNENFVDTNNDLRHRKSRTNYLIVEKIAYRMFQNSAEERYYINNHEINEIIQNSELNGLTAETVRQTCVLCAYWKNTSTLGALEFYHNNIRDFFLCEYLYELLYAHFQKPQNEQWYIDLITILCKTFAWGDIAGTTWEQAFSFLYLRLQFESEHSQEDNDLYTLLQKNVSFSLFPGRLIRTLELWSNSCAESPYISAKHIFCNSLMLYRILEGFSPRIQQGELISLWCSEEDKITWDRMSILRDWHGILRKSVQISENDQIGIVSKTNLAALNLQRFVLDDADFQGCLFENANFGKASLSGATFAYANLKNVSFCGADLSCVDFSGATLVSVDFSGADLKGANFIGAQIQNCTWDGCALGYNNFSSATVSRLVVKKKAPNMIFSHAFVSNSVFQNCKFTDLVISNGTGFAETTFTNSELDGEIQNAQFVMCTFEKCNFTGVKSLSNIFFGGCSFFDASLHGLKFEEITFKDCDLRNSQFTNTTFSHCSISGQKTDLKGANFGRSNGTGLNYEGINFYNVYLRDAVGFDQCEKHNPYLALR